MRNILKIISVLIAFLLVLPALSLAGQYQVIRVVDGNTIVLNYKGKRQKVRLLYVNTPELIHPDESQTIPMGKAASDYTRIRLKGEYVDLEFEKPLRDRLGRLLAYVFIEGTNFNLELVTRGFTPYYTGYGLSKKYDKEFREAERYARTQELNIWGDRELTRKYLRLKSKWGQHRSGARSPSATIQAKKWKYVASKKSGVFHRLECEHGRRILPKELTGFKSREEAINSGRRPCRTCRP